jgi:peptide chain release factor 3
VQVFTPHDGSGAIVGVVGALQLDVLATRLEAEYGLQTRYEQSRFTICRWIASKDPLKLKAFVDSHGSSIADDLDGAPVFMSTSAFQLNYDSERNPEIEFTDVKDYQKSAA